MLKLKQNFSSYSLSYTTDEFVKRIEEDLEKFPFLLTEGRKTWFKDKPVIVNEIDKQLRKNFNIKESNKLVFSMYMPPEIINGKIMKKETLISDQKENVLVRIIISTIDEHMQIEVMGKESDKIEMRQWIAYQTPPLLGNMFKYKFENTKFIVLPAKKGFRSMRKSKAINRRYILVFDYIVNDEDIKDLTETIEKISGKHKDMKISEEDILQALNKLKS